MPNKELSHSCTGIHKMMDLNVVFISLLDKGELMWPYHLQRGILSFEDTCLQRQDFVWCVRHYSVTLWYCKQKGIKQAIEMEDFCLYCLFRLESINTENVHSKYNRDTIYNPKQFFNVVSSTIMVSNMNTESIIYVHLRQCVMIKDLVFH